jgi:hypothetical protein
MEGYQMNLIQYDTKDVTLSELNSQCRHEENVIIVNDDDNNGIVVLNKALLEKVALSAFLSKGLADIENGDLVDKQEFFDDFKKRLADGNV